MAKTAKEVFQKLADSNSAVKVNLFRQVDWLQQFEPEKETKDLEGKCYAFSLAYLIALRTGVDGGDYIATLEKAAEVQDQGIRREIYGDLYSATDIGKNLFGIQHSEKHRDLTMEACKLKFLDEQRFEQTFFRFGTMAQFVSADAPLYSLILAPNHGMAATATPMTNRGTYTYFDPNFGEVVLPSQSKFKSFITSLYSHSVFNKGYRRKQVAKLAHGETKKKQVAETKSLILTAQRFREMIN
jgi:hypothetical protein